MSVFFKELIAVSGISFMIMGRYIFYCLFPVFVKAAAMYLFDVKGMWKTSFSSLLCQFMMVGAASLAARYLHPELDILYALENTGIEKAAPAVLSVFVIAYLLVDLVMIRITHKGFDAGAKTFFVTFGADIVNFLLLTLMFSHQILITV